MEPCGIASNFTGFGPLRRNFKTRENNPMHSRTGIDNKGEFLAPKFSVMAGPSRPSTA
ncbi:hypothetical protein ACVIU7_001711 [Bradyrhizobium liaoningense]